MKAYSRITAFVLAALITVSAVVGCSGPKDAAESSEEVSITEAAYKEIESGQETKAPEPEFQSVAQTLGLCITDIMYSENSAAKCRYNYRKFAEMGIKTVRLTTSWTSSKSGSYILDSTSEDMIKAALSAGMRIKLTLPNVDAPPSYIFDDDGARFEDENGRLSLQNCVSYWYDGIYDYSEDAVKSMLSVLRDKGYLEYIDALVVTCGPACEPLYPAAWTQNGQAGMWCYAQNAQADFRTEMCEKYGDIATANAAWHTGYDTFDAVSVPKPGETSGKLWEDVLLWYRDVKRDFVERQTRIFSEAVDEYSDGRIKLILYMPGEAYSEADWAESVSGGDTCEGLMIMSENEFIVRTAWEYGAYLQFTGLPGITSLKRALSYIHDNGYSCIPVYGENVNDAGAASDPAALLRTVMELNLAGIDYTTSQYLFKNDYITKDDEYTALEEAMPTLTEFILSRDSSIIPYQLVSSEAAPEGNILEYTVKAGSNSSLLTRIIAKNVTLKTGDMLEYDVFIPEGTAGIGQIDAQISGSLSLYENTFSSDRYGVRCSETDLSGISGKWVHRVVNLSVENYGYDGAGNNVGKRLQTILLRCSFSFAGTYKAYFDNIVITNGEEVRTILFDGSSELSSVVVKDTEIRNAASSCRIVDMGTVSN